MKREADDGEEDLRGTGMGAEVKRIWKITGYDGATEIFSEEVSGALTDGEIGRILQRLVARHLTEREVVAASLRKNMAGYASLLEWNFDRTAPKGNMVRCGENPYYVAFRERVL
jgi:hypothetical protein